MRCVAAYWHPPLYSLRLTLHPLLPGLSIMSDQTNEKLSPVEVFKLREPLNSATPSPRDMADGNDFVSSASIQIPQAPRHLPTGTTATMRTKEGRAYSFMVR